MPATKTRRRTETLRFMGTRPDAEDIARRAQAFLPEWTVVETGSPQPGRSRQGGTVFDVKVRYTKIVGA